MKRVGNLEVGINVGTNAVDEAIEKVDELGSAINDISPQLSIRGCRDCTFNIYPSRTVFIEKG